MYFNRMSTNLLPNPKMQDLLRNLYQPCPNFGTCPEAQWNPLQGQIPRGFKGCTGELNEVEVIMVFAEPGHPIPENESYNANLSADEYIRQSVEYGFYKLENGLTNFYQNVRWFFDQLYPATPIREWSKKVWMTESRLCSIDDEIGHVSGPYKSLCAEIHLGAVPDN